MEIDVHALLSFRVKYSFPQQESSLTPATDATKSLSSSAAVLGVDHSSTGGLLYGSRHRRIVVVSLHRLPHPLFCGSISTPPFRTP